MRKGRKTMGEGFGSTARAALPNSVHIAPEHLTQGWFQLRCAVSENYAVDFKALGKKYKPSH